MLHLHISPRRTDYPYSTQLQPKFASSTPRHKHLRDNALGTDQRPVLGAETTRKSFLSSVIDGIHRFFQNVLFLGAIVLASWIPSQRLRNYIETRALYEPSKGVALDHLGDKALEKKIRIQHFKAPDGTALEGWYIPAKKGKPTILYAHGRSSNMADTKPVILAFSQRGYGIMVVDYRGFGNSAGTPTEQGVSMDLEAASTHLAKKLGVPSSQQVLVGNSLGGAIAADVATRKPFKAVMLTSTFTSLKETLKYHREKCNWLLRHLVAENIVKAQFDTLKKIPLIQSPLLIAQGEADDVTPPSMGERLIRHARGTRLKHLFRIKACDHYQVFRSAANKVIDRLEWLLKKIDDIHGSAPVTQ